MEAYYAIPGETEQSFCKPRHAPKGAVLMNVPRPSENHVCRTEGCADGFGVWLIDEMAVWIEEIGAETMSREVEEIWDVIGIQSAPEYTKEKYNRKKEIRGRKPQ